MIDKGVRSGPATRDPFHRAGTLQSVSVNVKFVMGEHSIQRRLRFRHYFYCDKVSDKVPDEDKEASIPNPQINVQTPETPQRGVPTTRKTFESPATRRHECLRYVVQTPPARNQRLLPRPCMNCAIFSRRYGFPVTLGDALEMELGTVCSNVPRRKATAGPAAAKPYATIDQCEPVTAGRSKRRLPTFELVREHSRQALDLAVIARPRFQSRVGE